MISCRFFVGIQVWAQLIPEPWEDNRVIVSIKLTDTIVMWKTGQTLQLERAKMLWFKVTFALIIFKTA